MVARLLREQEVAGSNPVAPTKLKSPKSLRFRAFSFLAEFQKLGFGDQTDDFPISLILGFAPRRSVH